MHSRYRIVISLSVPLALALILAALMPQPAAPAVAAPAAGIPLTVKIITPTAPLTIPAGVDAYISATVSGEGIWAGAYFYFASDSTGGLDNWLRIWYPNNAAPGCVPYPATETFWTPPFMQYTRARVRVDLVSDCINPTVVASATGELFQVEPVRVFWLRPRNNEVLRPGTVYPLRWGINDTFTVVDHVQLSYSLDGIGFGPLPGAFSLRPTNSFQWTVFNSATTSLYLRVEACAQGEFCQNMLGAAVVGPLRVSADPNERSLFLTYPANGPDPNGETPVFFYNLPEPVTWGSTGNPPNLYLQYSLDAGATYPAGQVFGDCLVDDGKETWTPPETNVTQAIMRLTSRTNCTGGPETLQDVSTPFIISIKRWNRRPYAVAGPNQTALEGTSIVLDGSASSDRDGDALNYQWTMLQSYPAPLTVTLNASRSAIANFIAPSVQTTATLSFQLQADDGPANPSAPLSARDRVQVTVAPAPPAVSGVAPTCGGPGALMRLDGSNLAGALVTIGGSVAGTFGDDSVLTATVPGNVNSGPLGLRFPDGRSFALPYTFTVAALQVNSWSLTQNFQDYSPVWRKDSLVQIFPGLSAPAPGGCALGIDSGSIRIRRTTGYSVTLSAPAMGGALQFQPQLTASRHLTASINVPIRAQDLDFPYSDLAGFDLMLYQNGQVVASRSVPGTAFGFTDMPNNLRILTVFLFYQGAEGVGYAPLVRDWDAGIRSFLRAYPVPNVDMRTFLWPPIVWTTDELVDLSDCNSLLQRICRRNELGGALEDLRNDWNDHYENVPGRSATNIQMIIDRSAQDPRSNSAGVGWRPGTGNSWCRKLQNSCWERVSIVFARPGTPGATGPIMGQEVGHDFGLVDSAPNCCAQGSHSIYNESQANSTPCADGTSFARSEVDQNLKDGNAPRGRLVIGIGLSQNSPLEFENDPAVVACAAGRQAKSVMSYAGGINNDNGFLERVDYDAIKAKILSNEYGGTAAVPARAPQTAQDFFISGAIDRAGNVQAGLSRLLPALALSVPLTHTSPYTLAFFDNGGLLSSYPVSVQFESAHGDDSGIGVFSARWPFPPSTTRIEIRWNGASIWSRNVSAHAPVVSVLAPAGGETFSASQPLTITWSASDADGDPLHYNLSYSGDGGATFTPIFIGITRTQVAWHSLLAPASASGLIRVEASDGIRTGFGDSGQFAVAPHPPLVEILEPQPGAVFHVGDVVALRGAAVTPEDGFLADDRLSWESSLNGPLGAGAHVHNGSLVPGTHFITLTAVSPTSGLSVTRSLTLEIVAHDRWADAHLSIAGTQSAHAGDLVTYTVTYGNHGNFSAHTGRVKVRFPWLPNDLAMLAGSPGPIPYPFSEADPESGITELSWELGDLPPDSEGFFVFRLRTDSHVPPGAGATVSAQLEHLSPEANSSDDHALVTTHVDGRVTLPVIRR